MNTPHEDRPANTQPSAAGEESPAPGPGPTPPPPPPPGQGYIHPGGLAPSLSQRLGSNMTGGRKSTVLACLLSALMPGLGLVYVGYYRRGFVAALVFASTIAVLSSNAARGLEPLFAIFLGFWYLYNIVDAGRRASLVNMAVDGLRAPDVAPDFKLPGEGGSLTGGVLLIGLGTILFLHTRFDFELDWLADWWPVILIAFGVDLVVRGMRSRSQR